MKAKIARRLAVAVVAALVLPASAAADGDPASDVLLGQAVFYPFAPQVSAGLQRTLNAETAAATRAHFPLKLALIASPVDLGAIPELFDKPQQYANFLDQEISFQSGKQPLLVVMPNGYGVSGLDHAATAAALTLAKPRSGRSDELARAAILAVPKLASASGHRLAGLATTRADRGSSSVLPEAVLAAAAILGAGAIVALRSRRRRTGPAGSDLRSRRDRRSGEGVGHRRAPRR